MRDSMAAESAFLQALSAYLGGAGVLLPAPAQVGVSEPTTAAELPAVVLWLEEVHRLGAGLGERAAMITNGALPVTARIDLANPVLPEEPSFRLLSDDRRTLVLPHGGWVKADGTSGLLSSADLQVSVAGAARTVVNAAPGAGEVQPDATTGTLLFGAALPAAGIVQATYVLGQWEQRVTPIAGALRIDVRAASSADAQSLSAAVMAALDVGAALPRGMRKVLLGQVSSIGLPVAAQANARGRSLQFTFEYEHEINRPDSSGGVIRRIPITTRLQSTSIEPASGAIVTTVFSEVDP
jgi:hypothetical protein